MLLMFEFSYLLLFSYSINHFVFPSIQNSVKQNKVEIENF